MISGNRRTSLDIILGSLQEVFNSLRELLTAMCTQLQDDSHTDTYQLFKRAQWKMRKLHAKHNLKQILESVAPAG